MPSANEPYQVNEKPLGEPRHLRVITIGAGAAGLNLARQVDKHMKNVDHVIYEKSPDVGGTWFENRYPGCACDIPSHNYQFTWEPCRSWLKNVKVDGPVIALHPGSRVHWFHMLEEPRWEDYE